jgi:formylglycine-generating enzyme required for sulfatase activity/energy-coupling factor transporter ATP-binding protein EcfA2
MFMGKKKNKEGRHTAMKMKKLLQMLCLVGCIIFPTLLNAQQQSKFNWTNAIPWVIAFLMFLLALISYLKLRKDTIKKRMAELEAQKEFDKKEQTSAAKTAEEIYHAALKEKLGTIFLPGSPDIECKPVSLEDAFVSLCISESQRVEERFAPDKKMIPNEMGQEHHFSPEEVMIRAFKKYRLLLVIGDPGSGKTTLLKYYAVNCLNNKYKQFGFKEAVFPIYFPLRELEFDENEKPRSLPYNLAKWSERHVLNISAEQFRSWLHKRKTLVLLDGLDEISSKEKRQKVPLWVKETYTGLTNAFFVVTSRATGYRKLDGIELEMSHLRADIMDFTLEQQVDFLEKWFNAVFLSGLPPKGINEKDWEKQQLNYADTQSKAVIVFLKKEENKSVRELAAVPMLLQIMAIIWEKHQYIPHTRVNLYDVALNYLLDYRDRKRNIKPLLPVADSYRVLAPTALWMQEDLKQDEAPKEQMHQTMQPILNTLTSQPNAVLFCEHLRDRAGLIADYDKEHYIFRHKSFREFLAGIRLKEEAHKQKQKRIKNLVQHFKDDWWEETLRFFMSKADDEIFDRFMRAFFKSKVSQELNAHQQNLLQQLVMEAPQKRIDALTQCLNSEHLNNNQKRYVMDCLKTIGTPEAVGVVNVFIERSKEDKITLDHARDIVAELTPTEAVIVEEIADTIPGTFRNSFEDNVEYIKIPGGTYKYSVNKKMVTVPDLFFCKYPVTNKRYRRFISFLEGKESKLSLELPVELYAEKLLKFSESLDEYKGYLVKYNEEWQDKLRSEYEDDKHFKGDDQPVVGVTWYAARAYCFWLSCLDAVLKGDSRLKDIKMLSETYRLPTEVEWEWAAGGNPDGSMRQYAWAEDKGEPNSKLANYDKNVGATTPVGRYPEGATPLGLMDMAGNVWEWMEILYKEDTSWRAVRGGSWYDAVSSLRCSARYGFIPVDGSSDGGFRVVRSQS